MSRKKKGLALWLALFLGVSSSQAAAAEMTI